MSTPVVPSQVSGEENTVTTAPLHGCTVLEIGTHPGARYCGRSFARAGATVLSAGPLRVTRSDRRLDDYLDDGKRILRTDSAVLEAAAAADVLLGDHQSPWARFGQFGRWHGHTVPFGISPGERENWTGGELVMSSLGGAADFTRAKNGTPLYGFGHRYEFLAGLYLHFALLCRMNGGEPPDPNSAPVDVTVSLLETVVSILPCHTTQFEYNGNTETVGQTGARHVLACRDGWVAIYAGGPWSNIVRFLGSCAPQDEEVFVQNGSRVMHTAELDVYLGERVREMTVAEALAHGEETNVAIADVPDPGAVLADKGLAQRQLWEPRVLPDGRHATAPGSGVVVNGIRG